MLKALELTGFKSFADRTRFEFHEGVTVVVGPNGSGKSNVVDAIKWVLGSQSAKSLRGGEMTDVIFNGSGSRAALHTAEATLVLDNAGGVYGGVNLGEEVSITRRVYRSGEGEYLINGGACRLRDIRDLLAGTGIGTEAYSIIEQGKVDALLQASPRDRRALFEEAAGISRFRGKRQEAGRRLARVEQNLLRLSDIVDEVESRMRSVRMQAGKAQRYRDGAKRLKELRTEIGVVDWFRLTDRISSISTELNTFSTDEEKRKQWIESTELQLPKIDDALDRQRRRREQIDKQLAKLREQAASIYATQYGRRERERDLAANVSRLNSQWLATKQVESSDGPDLSQLAAKLEAARSEYDDQSRALAETSERAKRLAVKIERSERQLEEIRRRLRETNTNAQRAVESQRHLAQQNRQQRQTLTELEKESAEIDSKHNALEQQTERASSECKQSEQKQKVAEQRLKAAQQDLASSESAATDCRHKLQKLSSKLQSLEHRIELATELNREQSYAQQEVREFVSSTLGIEPTVIADLLHVDVDSAPVIEAALGKLAEFLVVPSTSQLAEVASSLPRGAKLVRLDHTAPLNALDRLDLNGQRGVWGRADTFVDSHPDHQGLVRRLLGRTWIVDSLATAVQMYESVGPGLNFVTADGDYFGADGTLVAGSRAQASLTRKNQMDQLERRAAQLRPQKHELESESNRLDALVAERKDQLAEALQAQRDALEVAAAHREAAATATSRAEVQGEQRRRVSEQYSLLKQEVLTTEAQVQQLTDTSAAHAKQSEQLQKTASAVEELVLGDRAKRDALQAAEKQREVATAKLEQQIEVLTATLHETTSTAPSRDVRAELHQQLETLRVKRMELELERLAGSQQLATLHWQIGQLEPLQRESFAERQTLVSQKEAAQEKLQAERRQLEESQTRRSQLELSLAKLDHQRQSLAERLLEDYEIDLPVVAQNYSLNRPKIDRKQAQREIDELRNGLNRIGSVNVDALEELEEIESRYEAISAQYNDLSQAKTSLEKLMAKLNVESRQRFLDTVETVRGHFQELFRRLFGGGDADLLLEEYDSDDALDCGVEIRASPPGKDTRTISLLSGGEKTMTCVALLLAMFRSKPSPFCVLDEVDAALDEANVGRFTSVLSEFLSSTQFIVITHSKKTMTGADTLYGVTMQESGISKQVSVKFDDVTEDGFIKPRASRRDDPPPLTAAV